MVAAYINTFCCIPETDATLLINYTPIQKLKIVKKKKNK